MLGPIAPKPKVFLFKRLAFYATFITLTFTVGACAVAAPAAPLSLPERHLSTSQPVPADALVIENGTVVDGTERAPIPDGMVVVLNNRIVAVGHAVDYMVSTTNRVIDAAGGTILPGIINAHVHEAGSPLIRRFFFLSHGVTSVCDLASPLRNIQDYPDNEGYGPTARGFRAGPIINVPLGYPGAGELLYPVTSQEEARAAVDNIVDRGADVLKIALDSGNSKLPWQSDMGISIPNLDLPELDAIVQEAHTRGKLVRVHIGSADMLNLALDAGVDAVEHVPLPRLDEIDFQSLPSSPYAKLSPSYEAQLERMVRQNVIMTPTLDEIITWCESYAASPERKVLCRKNALSPVHRFVEMGGIIALGDDSTYGLRTTMPIAEMERLMAAGLTPLQVIKAGTRNAARVCGHGDELGTLELGKLADIIVTKGNPLVDIHALGQVQAVIVDGQVALPK